MSYVSIIRRICLSLSLCIMVLLLPLGTAQAKAFSDIDNEVPTRKTHIEKDVYDPLEPVNRKIYWFNTKVDTFLMKPIAKGYRKAVPLWGRQRVRSFLNNLNTPVDFFNAVFQGDVDQSFNSFWRFAINSSFGIGGLFDIASLTDLQERDEDFGQTLGVYGVGSGPYLVLPLLGPSTLRDTTGRVVDSVIDPFNYMDDKVVLARHGLSAIDTRESVLELIDQIEGSSLDPYAGMRSMYMQNQNDKIRNGATLPSYYNMDLDW